MSCDLLNPEARHRASVHLLGCNDHPGVSAVTRVQAASASWRRLHMRATDSCRVMVQLDFETSFNPVSRQQVLETRLALIPAPCP